MAGGANIHIITVLCRRRGARRWNVRDESEQKDYVSEAETNNKGARGVE